MRREIMFPDTTRPEVKGKLATLTEHLSAHPEFVEELFRENHEPIPDYMAIIDKIRESPNRFKTAEEVDAYFHALRDEWE